MRIEIDVSERLIDDIAQTIEAPAEHVAGRSGERHVAFLDGLECEHSRVEPTSKLVCEATKALIHGLDALLGSELISLAPELRHGVGDGIVEAPIEGVKFVDRDCCLSRNGRSDRSWRPWAVYRRASGRT